MRRGDVDPRPLPADLLARVRRIEIQARRLVASVFLGEYHSVFRGRGIEFSEVRQYQPGDDVRAIDWNVTARLGSPYVKKYIEERELTVLLVVDVSASSGFTSTGVTKRQLAAEVAATLAFAAIASNDRVGLVTFSDRVERFVPPGKSRTHALRIVRELLDPQPQGRGTDVAAALAYVMRVARRRAIVFVLSDFFDEGFERQMRAAAARHEVLALSLDDPRESTLPDVGLLELEDAETGARALLDTSDARVRGEYARRASERLARRRRAFAAAGVETVTLSTGRPYVGPLLRAFRARGRRREAALSSALPSL
jgi:uncharacterized protein (DUF58 family)